MKLNDLIKGEQETVNEYLARTYWNIGKWPLVEPKVLVYNSPADVCNEDKKPVKIISHDKAIEYIQTLFDNEPEPTRTEPEPEPETKGEVMLITEEYVDGEVISQIWIDSDTGEVCHRFGEAGGIYNGN